MVWIKKTAMTVLSGLCIPMMAWGDPFDAQRVPVDAKWVIHIDMDAARHSKTWEAVDDHLANNEGFQSSVAQIEQATGMQFPDDVHDVTLYGRAAGDEAGVVVLHGKIDHNRTIAALQMNPDYTQTDYGKYQVMSWPDKEKKLFGAFHDDSTVVVGRTQANIEAALDTMDAKAECVKEGPLAAGATPQLLVYVAVKDLAGLQRDKDAQSPLLKRISSGWVGLSEKDGNAVVHANLTTATPEMAEQLHTAIEGIKAMVSLAAEGANADPKAKAAANALQTLHPASDGKIVSVDWPIPLDQVTGFIASLPVKGH